MLRRLGRPLAAVLGRVERAGKGLVLRATDRRLREDYLLTELHGAAPGDLVRARVSHLRRAGKGLAEVVEVIGPADPGAASALSIAEQDIPVEFSAAALAEAARAMPPPSPTASTCAPFPSSPSTVPTRAISTTRCSHGPKPMASR